MPRTRSAERTQFLTDVLTTAVEGGIGYWSKCSGYDWSADDPAERGVTLYVDSEEIDREQIKVADVGAERIDFGGMFFAEERDAWTFRLTLDDIARGIGIVTRGEAGVASSYVGTVHAASVANDAGELDSDDADIVIQAAAFGTVIFG